MIPFEGAFAANVTQVMPYYGIPTGQTSEDVAMGFNKDIITDLLRGKFGFDGVVCTDWGIVEGMKMMGVLPGMAARAWGVDDLSINERYQKVIEAGVDQFGGQFTPHHIVELVQAGIISEARLDESVARILRLKFQMGLFDNPYVDEETVRHKVGTSAFRAAGNEAMRRSMVLLKNDENVLPLANRPKLYLENVAEAVAQVYGDIVATPEEADFAILRLKTPYGPKQSKDFLENFFHQGDLDFKEPEKSRLAGDHAYCAYDCGYRDGENGRYPRNSRVLQRIIRQLPGHRRSGAGRHLWRLQANRQTARRNALVHGGRAQPKRRPALRFGKPTVPVWAWPNLSIACKCRSSTFPKS